LKFERPFLNLFLLWVCLQSILKETYYTTRCESDQPFQSGFKKQFHHWFLASQVGVPVHLEVCWIDQPTSLPIATVRLIYPAYIWLDTTRCPLSSSSYLEELQSLFVPAHLHLLALHGRLRSAGTKERLPQCRLLPHLISSVTLICRKHTAAHHICFSPSVHFTFTFRALGRRFYPKTYNEYIC